MSKERYVFIHVGGNFSSVDVHNDGLEGLFKTRAEAHKQLIYWHRFCIHKESMNIANAETGNQNQMRTEIK